LAQSVGQAARQKRLAMNLTRAELAERAGVPAPTLRRFEETGLAPFLTVIRLAFALEGEVGVKTLFSLPDDLPATLDELIKAESKPSRRRATGIRGRS